MPETLKASYITNIIIIQLNIQNQSSVTSAHTNMAEGPNTGCSYHQEVIEEEDFSLMEAKFLRLVWVRHLEQPAVTHQPSVR